MIDAQRLCLAYREVGLRRIVLLFSAGIAIMSGFYFIPIHAVTMGVDMHSAAFNFLLFGSWSLAGICTFFSASQISKAVRQEHWGTYSRYLASGAILVGVVTTLLFSMLKIFPFS